MLSKHPECRASTKKLCDYDDCGECHNNSVAGTDKAEFWSVNNDIPARKVFRRARKFYKYTCKVCPHELSNSPDEMSRKDDWCSYCINRKLCGIKACTYCLKKSFAMSPKAKYWSEKNTAQPWQVFMLSTTKRWFKCNKCHHHFDVRPYDCVKRNYWCNYCAGKKLCKDPMCKWCFERSFASHPKAKYWSAKNKVSPRDVLKNSHKECFFDCDCGHIFSSRLYSIVKGCWCGYCNGDLFCDDIEGCDFCFDTSFAGHYRAKFWSAKNKISPRFVSRCSRKKFWFDCNQCPHDFEGILSNITQNDAWCPYCSNPPKKLCSDNECKECKVKSLASHPCAVYWSKNNKCSPRFVFKNSHKKHKFDCKDCKNEFQAKPNHVVSGGTWCPLCKKKTEKKLYDWLVKTYPNLVIKREQTFAWCANPETNRKLPYDFYINSLKLIIELDGPQHFRQIHNWEPPEEVKVKDRYKEMCATINSVTIIRLLQEDVLKDVNNWEANLIDMLDRIDVDDDICVYSIYTNSIECMSYDLDEW